MRFASPPSSAPRTERAVVVPVTGEGVALAAVATVGAAFETATLAVPLIAPLVARTVALPAVEADEYRPLELIDPTPPESTK